MLDKLKWIKWPGGHHGFLGKTDAQINEENKQWGEKVMQNPTLTTCTCTTSASKCPIHLDLIHCSSCRFNPTHVLAPGLQVQVKCEWGKFREERRK